MTREHRLSIALAVALALAACAYFFASSLAFANDIDAGASASADVHAETKRPGILPMLKSEAEKKRLEVQGILDKKRADIQANIEARIGADRDKNASTSANRPEKHASPTDARADVRGKAAIEAVVKNMIARLSAAVDRFENIASRIDSRIEKLKGEGVDVSAAVTLQATAKTAIAEADAKVAAIVKPSLSDSATREDIRAAFEASRAHVKAANEAVQAAHKALREAVAALKRIDASAHAEASASGSTNN